MIKHFCVIFVFAFLFMSPITVHADVVMGNDFYYQNKGKTEAVGERQYGKRFIINSPSGYVIPKEEPGSEKGVPSGMGYRSGWGYDDIDEPEDVVFVFKNGDIFTIEATYLYNGKYWGVMSPSHRYQPTGWVLMDDLLVIYDRPYFEAENKDKFYTYTGSYDAVLSAERLVEWQWPGSDSEKRIIDDNIPKYANVLFAYIDDEGREWGKTSYSEGWICLSDPANSDIPVFNPALRPAKWSSDGNINWSADVTIWPPADNEKWRSANKPQSAFDNIRENVFFLQHSKEVQKLSRSRFYANGPDGYVALRAEPGMDGEILTHWAFGPTTYQNGAEISMDYAYNLNGEYWGFMNYASDRPHPPGWIPMDHLLVVYTNDDFINDHSEKLYSYTGDIRTAINTETFVLWEWPGSDREGEIWDSGRLDKRTPITKNAYIDKEGREWVYNYDKAIKWLYIENAYEDEEGREWIYIETYLNRPVMGWICVSDPENREILSFNPAPAPIKWSPDGIYDWSSNDNDVTIWPPVDISELPSADTSESPFNMTLLIVFSVFALVAVTAVLILIFGKRNKIGKEKE